MFQKKDLLIFVSVCFVLGFLLIRQFYATKELAKITQAEDNQLLTLEISHLIKADSDLRLEIKEQSVTLEKYEKALEDRKSAAEALEKDLEKYKIIAGVTKIEGPGVLIKVEGGLGKEEMVDLVNALRNIGIEGLSLNKKRIVLNSSFSGGQGPFIFEVIGNGPLIKEALERKGGIIEQIKSNNPNVKIGIEKKEKIQLEKLEELD